MTDKNICSQKSALEWTDNFRFSFVSFCTCALSEQWVFFVTTYITIYCMCKLFVRFDENPEEITTQRYPFNKTVIYFWMKTKIVWTAHYKGIFKIFSPRLSDHFHTVHLACTQRLLQMKDKQGKKKMSICKETGKKGNYSIHFVERWLIVQLPSVLVWF